MDDRLRTAIVISSAILGLVLISMTAIAARNLPLSRPIRLLFGLLVLPVGVLGNVAWTLGWYALIPGFFDWAPEPFLAAAFFFGPLFGSMILWYAACRRFDVWRLRPSHLKAIDESVTQRTLWSGFAADPRPPETGGLSEAVLEDRGGALSEASPSGALSQVPPK